MAYFGETGQNISACLINTYSMKGYCLIYFEHRNDVTSIVKFCFVKLDYACDVMSMFKINYTITFHGISVL